LTGESETLRTTVLDLFPGTRPVDGNGGSLGERITRLAFMSQVLTTIHNPPWNILQERGNGAVSEQVLYALPPSSHSSKLPK
jgi:hypothetical protein